LQRALIDGPTKSWSNYMILDTNVGFA
jgi:hypothetical protein